MGDNMKVYCSSCHIYIRDKEPLADDRITHGLCDKCYKQALVELSFASAKEFRRVKEE